MPSWFAKGAPTPSNDRESTIRKSRPAPLNPETILSMMVTV
jgi:hypothetical protein